MKSRRLKCFIVDGQVKYVEQKRWGFVFWLTPYLAGSFMEGFDHVWRFFGEGYSWYDHNPYGGIPEHKKVMRYYD